MNLVSETTKKANGHWPFILQAQGIVVPANRQHGACPHCGGKDRFRFDDKAGRGTWFCNQCGHGDGLDLLCLVSGLDKVSAATEVAKALSLAPSQSSEKTPARKEATDAQKRAQMTKRFQALAKEAVSGESIYLKKKGLSGHQYLLTAKPFSMAGLTFPPGSMLLPLQTLDGHMTGAQ